MTYLYANIFRQFQTSYSHTEIHQQSNQESNYNSLAPLEVKED